MPAATWFRTTEDAHKGISALEVAKAISPNDHGHLFHHLMNLTTLEPASIKESPEIPILLTLLSSEEGLNCLALACKSDAENAARIKFVIDTYLSGTKLEVAGRAGKNWQDVNSMPFEFYCNFRIKQ